MYPPTSRSIGYLPSARVELPSDDELLALLDRLMARLEYAGPVYVVFEGEHPGPVWLRIGLGGPPAWYALRYALPAAATLAERLRLFADGWGGIWEGYRREGCRGVAS